MVSPNSSNRWVNYAVDLFTFSVLPVAYLLARTAADADDNLRGAAIASVVCALLGLPFWSAYRALGFIPYSAVLWVGVAVYGLSTGDWPGWLIAIPFGIIAGALNRFWLSGGKLPAARGLTYPVLIPFVIVWYELVRYTPPWLPWLFLAQTVAIAVIAWTHLFRPATELAAEPLLWVMFHVRGTGPGLKAMPPTGPCLVVANHACWFDPLVIAKALPRRVTPMMTARFFNLPVIRWFMRRFGVIRVSEKVIRRDAPEEVKEAIAALDRGECVMIFPESFLRRTEERVLRRFARGVWQILHARPDTPVFACWVEGAWGSYTSYWNGPPTKNKKRDVRRPIRIGVSDAIRVPADVLPDHLRTRMFLMNEVAASRKLLGLPELPRFELPQGDGGADDAE
jgi:1-acyl-sn-glycerol-3-phosphate acyltransferase